MKHILVAAFLFTLSVVANAAGTASISCQAKTPTIVLTYSTDSDSGSPGVTYVALVSPDEQSMLMLDITNTWTQYTGGQFMPNVAYESGLPASTKIKITLPGYSSSTWQYAGYSLYAGHGALTTKDMHLVQVRRDALNKAKPALVAKGAWIEQYQTDDLFKLSLAQKNMTDGNKYNRVLVIPQMECEKPGS